MKNFGIVYKVKELYTSQDFLRPRKEERKLQETNASNKFMKDTINVGGNIKCKRDIELLTSNTVLQCSL